MFRSRSSKVYRSAGMGSAVWWLIAAATVIISRGTALEGQNICTRQETYTITVKVSERKPYNHRYTTWCVSLPPRCTKYKTEYTTVWKDQEVTKQKIVEECCKGYKETTSGDRCIPVCSKDCRYGTCIAPDVCKCESGYGDPLCDFKNMTCNHVTGQYVCCPGYLDVTCEHPCPPNRYGLNCTDHCHCKNGGECHHVTGVCQCRPGWQGEYCQSPCAEGTYGVNCTQHCKCQNGGKCRFNDGHCRCPPGWTGTMCTEICPEGYYGDYCMEPCECKNEFFKCHPAEGCICRQGYTGENCDKQLFPRNLQKRGKLDVLQELFVILSVIFLIIGLIISVFACCLRNRANREREIIYDYI